jgi:hypothetical protein
MRSSFSSVAQLQQPYLPAVNGISCFIVLTSNLCVSHILCVYPPVILCGQFPKPHYNALLLLV